MTKKLDIVDLTASTNIAELLSEEQLADISGKVIDGYGMDKASCSDMEGTIKQAMKIAKQIKSEKTTPWPGASNVLYPLIASASISFAARTYPEIIRNGKVVEAAVLGNDPTGEKEERAHRISDHMSAQLLVEDAEWEGDTDRLLSCLPVLGTVFKKTFFDEYWKRNRSIMCTPDDIIVASTIKSLETAERITHKITMTTNDILSRIRLGLFCDIEEELMEMEEKGEYSGNDNPDTVLECHCYLDLDEDGYQEPYVVTVHEGLGKVLRIYHRWDAENVFMNSEDKIWRIDPVHYFTDFHFLRSPDGKYHGVGFGQLLLPINETINTVINQLLDSGTLSNMKSGFLSREFKIKSGSAFLTPGEWKKTDIPAEALQKGIMPLPVSEPSTVLFQLLGVMIEAGKELSSVSEVMQGQAMPQNAPATSVLALLEAGMKVFSSIQKRLYNSLKKEFGKLYRLNRIHLEDQIEYKKILGSLIISKEDYTDRDLVVIPVADPSMSSDAQRMARAQAMMQILPMTPPAGAQIILKNYLDALQVPDSLISAILPPPDPNAPPSPDMIKQQMEAQKAQMEMATKQMEMDLEAHKLDLQKMQTEINKLDVLQRNKESEARIQKMYIDSVLEDKKISVNADTDNTAMHLKAIQEANRFAEKESKNIEVSE